MDKDINCPYCNHAQDINHDDGFGYEQDVLHQMQCYGCGKEFVFRTDIVFYYNAFRADCLNTGNHEFKPTSTFPKCFSKMCCTSCGLERDLTNEERQDMGIPTVEFYFKNLIP